MCLCMYLEAKAQNQLYSVDVIALFPPLGEKINTCDFCVGEVSLDVSTNVYGSLKKALDPPTINSYVVMATSYELFGIEFESSARAAQFLKYRIIFSNPLLFL